MRRQKRRRGYRKRVILLILSIEILLILTGIAYIELRPMVVKAVTLEAGEEKLTVNKFLRYKNRQGTFVTDIEKLDTRIPGDYKVQIQVGRRVHTSLLKVVDTTPPKADVSDQFILRGESADPNAFISNIIDASEVKVYFRHIPDTDAPGVQEVSLLLQDSSGNVSEEKAKLTVLDIRKRLTVEAGTKETLSVKDFVENDKYDVVMITDLQTVNTNKPGSYPVELEVDKKRTTITVEVVDTIAPEASAKAVKVYCGDTPKAEDFVKDIKDASPVSVSYRKEPDFTKPGKKVIQILLKDSADNITELPVTVEVIEDIEAPVFSGITDKTVFIGDTVSYKKGVTVTDNRDKEVTFSVDNSEVNLKKAGTYTVTYTAKDAAGNKAVKTAQIQVLEYNVSEETINELCDKLLQQITNENMTKREIAYEIYRWVRNSIDYSGDSDKSDWLAEAYRGMTKKYGDCFTYFCVSKAILTRAGIDNLELTRVGGRTKHFWNLINCGNGWYHFDACPNKDHKPTFMLTDQQVEELTKERGNNYYVYDKSLYPVTPE
jgi:hypothetical protein